MASNVPPRPTRRVSPKEPNVGDLNLDPLTDEPGSHPVGTGVGAAGGAIAGAAIGAGAGPVGAAAGAMIGAVAGGLVGHAAGEAVNPTIGAAAPVVNPQDEDAYWRTAYVDAPYYSAGRTYDDYAPAYRLGYTSRGRYEGTFDGYEPTLASEWDAYRGGSRLTWDEAKAATRDAWDRVTV